MVKDPGKLRLWRIAELLYKQTDETHMLSAATFFRSAVSIKNSDPKSRSLNFLLPSKMILC